MWSRLVIVCAILDLGLTFLIGGSPSTDEQNDRHCEDGKVRIPESIRSQQYGEDQYGRMMQYAQSYGRDGGYSGYSDYPEPVYSSPYPYIIQNAQSQFNDASLYGGMQQNRLVGGHYGGSNVLPRRYRYDTTYGRQAMDANSGFSFKRSAGRRSAYQDKRIASRMMTLDAQEN